MNEGKTSSRLFLTLALLTLVAAGLATAQSRSLFERESGESVGTPDQNVVQLPTALLREGDELPGAPGEIVDSLNNPAVNHVGGFGLTVNTTGSGTTLSHIWGNASGGPGGVFITEGTYGNLMQTSFESFHGLSDAGLPCYSASAENLDTGTTGLDGVWVDVTPVLVEEDPVPTLPGTFSTFNSRPGITAIGEPYWIGGVSPVQGDSTQNRVLFFGYGSSVVLQGGDAVPGVPELIETQSSSIDFDFRFSRFGTNYITQVVVDTGSNADDGVVVINGEALALDGAVLREGSPVPASLGGLPGENWDNFDFFGITESGSTLITGDTDAATSNDEFLIVDGALVLREGDVLSTTGGDFTLAGTIEGGYLNDNGDWAVIWDGDDPGGANVEILLFNGDLIFKEGDEVDLDGDGIIDAGAVLANFTGLSALVVGDRDVDGLVSIYFTGDIDTEGTSSSSDDTEALFRIDVQIPPDGTTTLCHCPPGNPDNCKTINVGGNAASAHLANHDNDYLGACAPASGGPGSDAPEQIAQESTEGGLRDLTLRTGRGSETASSFVARPFPGQRRGTRADRQSSRVELEAHLRQMLRDAEEDGRADVIEEIESLIEARDQP